MPTPATGCELQTQWHILHLLLRAGEPALVVLLLQRQQLTLLLQLLVLLLL